MQPVGADQIHTKPQSSMRLYSLRLAKSTLVRSCTSLLPKLPQYPSQEDVISWDEKLQHLSSYGSSRSDSVASSSRLKVTMMFSKGLNSNGKTSQQKKNPPC